MLSLEKNKTKLWDDNFIPSLLKYCKNTQVVNHLSCLKVKKKIIKKRRKEQIFIYLTSIVKNGGRFSTKLVSIASN